MSFKADQRNGKHVVVNLETDGVVAICDTDKNAIWNARYFTLRNQGLSYEEAIKQMDKEGITWD